MNVGCSLSIYDSVIVSKLLSTYPSRRVIKPGDLSLCLLRVSATHMSVEWLVERETPTRLDVTKQASNFGKGYQTHHCGTIHKRVSWLSLALPCHSLLDWIDEIRWLWLSHTRTTALRIIDCFTIRLKNRDLNWISRVKTEQERLMKSLLLKLAALKLRIQHH